MSILTGFTELDNITGGLRPGELTVVAGRPCMGKSALCRSIAGNAVRSGNRAFIGIMRDGYIRTANLSGLGRFDYYCSPLEKAFKPVKPRTGKKFLVIFPDALHTAGRKEAADICSKLKAFAVAENIAVMVEAVADKNVERLENRRPMLEHIRYAAAVDKYADNVLIVFRPAYYDASADASLFEVNVIKSSTGRSGTVTLRFEISGIPGTACVPKITER